MLQIHHLPTTDRLLQASFLLARMWQQLFGHTTSGMIRSQRQYQDAPPSVAVEESLVYLSRQSVNVSPLYVGVPPLQQVVVTGGEMEFHFKCCLYASYTPAHLRLTWGGGGFCMSVRLYRLAFFRGGNFISMS